MAFFKNFFWPDLHDLETAKKYSSRAAGFAFFVAVVTAAVAFAQTQLKLDIIAVIDAYSYIDAALFAVIGIFLLRCSRTAAVAGLLLYLGDQWLMAKMMGAGYRVSVLAVLITFGFVSAVRATFAYHRMRAERKKADEAPVLDVLGVPRPRAEAEAPEAAAKKSRPGKVLQILLFLLAGLLFAAAAFHFVRGLNGSPRPESRIQAPHSAPPSLPRIMPAQADEEPVSGPKKTFRMKDGSTVTGTVTYEDEDYATVITFSGPVTVIKEDVQS